MQIMNFTNAYGLTVKSRAAFSNVPKLVVLTHCDGPCSFQHDMTPDQARQMAAALLAAADELDGVQE